jgi:hypothetical protein
MGWIWVVSAFVLLGAGRLGVVTGIRGVRAALVAGKLGRSADLRAVLWCRSVAAHAFGGGCLIGRALHGLQDCTCLCCILFSCS